MKTKTKVIQENPDYKTLINAVVSRIGKESIEDVNRYGISGGYGGFVYYSDTVTFYKRHRSDINSMVFETAKELGEDPVSMVASFNCLTDDHDIRHDIGLCIYGSNLRSLKINDQVPNALAWFAAEQVCRMFEY